MQINQMSATFGKLDNARLTLQPALNIICAPNESGKSTWCHFIRTMLYGLPPRERGPLADKHRYAPWSGAAMGGTMTFTHQGQKMTAIRQTRRADAPMGEFRCVYHGTSDPVPGMTGTDFGQTILGVSREVYVRSALIGQGKLFLDKDAELERRISSLIGSGEEDTSFSDAHDRLKKQLHRRRHNKSGLIPSLEQEIAQLDGALQQLHSLQQQEQSLRMQLVQYQQQAQDLQIRLAQWDALEKQAALHSCLQAEKAALEAKSRVRALQDSCPGLPRANQLSRMSGLADVLTRTQDAAHRAEADATATQTEADAAQARWQAHPLYPNDESQLSDRLARIAPELASFSPWAAFFALMVGGAAAFAFWHFLSQLAIAIGTGLAISAALLIIYNSIRLRRNRAALRLAEAQRSALKSEIDAYLQLRQQYDAAQERAQHRSAASQTLHRTYHEGLLQLLSFVQPFAPYAATLPDICAALEQGLALRERLDLAQTAALEAQHRHELLRQSLPQGPLPDPAEPLPRPAIGRAQLSAALSRITDSISNLRSQLDVLTGQIRAGGDRDILESRLSHKRTELAQLHGEYRAISAAMDALSRADQTMQSRFSPQLGRRAAEIFAALTDGNYHQVLFDRSFALSATPSGDSIPRSIQTLSQGAADQLYLATRLAICQLVLPSDDPAPLILDDALANFDDARMAAALDWLVQAAQTQQILLFTCHTREAEYLADRDGVSICSL